jgi:RNA polymerase sigma-70 factor (ECF subfamily)
MIASAFSLTIPMETEEAQIARGLRRRDPDLLDALIEQYQHRLLRYLLHLTGNRAVAEDLFQEVWVRVLEKGHLYDGRNRFVTWLMSIAHNVAIDHLRKRNPASLDEMQNAEDGTPFEPPSGEPSPFEQVASHQQQQMFSQALERVSPLFREVLVLRFQEQMKLEEIAKLIHIPLATVKTRIYRGVMALKPLLQPAPRKGTAEPEPQGGGAQ